jgi:hypothetical protein
MREVFMRTVTFLAVPLLLTVVLFARSYFPGVSTPIDRAIAQMPQTRPDVGTDSERMWTRAEIRVLPLDLVSERRAELDSLRSRVAQAKIDDLKLGRANPDQRERAVRNINHMTALLTYIDQERSDQGKSIPALEVQRHLNEIEGRVNCQACHTGFVANGNTSTPTMRER